MKTRLLLITVVIGLSAMCASAQDTRPAAAPDKAAATIGDAYPTLASAALIHAKPAVLPDGTLLRAGDLTITQKEIDAEIAKAPEALRKQLSKNAFFILEQMTTRRLLLAEARQGAIKDSKDASKLSEQELLKSHFEKLASGVKVTDAEVVQFYENNKDVCGGQKLEDIKDVARDYLRQQKQQEAVDKHVQTIGKRIDIAVAGDWVKAQAKLAKDNPVDRVRGSGKPSLVDFGSQGCIPCDKLAPILETLKTKYDGKANVLFVSVREEQILASRYGIQSIPVQIFFDKNGKEVFRHTGFWPQDELEKKLAEMGAK